MSRSVDKLEPETRKRVLRFLASAEASGIDLLVTCTLRIFQEQAELYAIGRTKPGRKVTNAGPGDSWHNWGRAIDVVPLRHGKPVWGTTGNGIDSDPTDDDRDDLELWQTVGALGKAEGLEWAGDWKRFPEFPHFQYTEGLSLATLKAAHPRGLT